MDATIQKVIRQHSRPLDPRPTGQKPRLRNLPGIKAVLFDIYGTLFISGSGDIGSANNDGRADAFLQTLRMSGIQHQVTGPQGVERLLSVIHRMHADAKASGIEHPEVDIVQVWREALQSLATDGLVAARELHSSEFQQLAIQYEVRTNPVWPMPGCVECLESLRDDGRLLGLISNAQAFTLELFPALLNADFDQLAVHSQLRFFSYTYRQAKPGLFLFRLAADALADLGIATSEVLYVGNDMRNDIYPAHKTSFQTALFAGDERSLRLRSEDERVQGLTPDLIITELQQIPPCLRTS